MSSKNKPLVSIIIVNWNKKELTADCLQSLKKTSYPNFNVVLIDNGSTDGSVEHLKKVYPRMHIIKLNKNYGYTEGTNIGWKYALKEIKADYICAMDNDIATIQKSWLDLIINELEKSPKNGIGSGKHLFPDGRLQTPYEGADASYKKDTGKYDFTKEVGAFVGPCILIKRQVIEKIGYYDENFFYGPNDLDYCYRAGKAGFKRIYVGKSKSVHIGSASGRSPAKDLIYRHQSEGMMTFSFRYGGWKEKIHMVLRQFARAFATRIDPVAPQSWNNTLWHINFSKRIYMYFISLYHSVRKYNIIKSSNENEKIIEIRKP